VRLWDARRAVLEDTSKNRMVEKTLGRSLRGNSEPQFFIEAFEEMGTEALREKVAKPLSGLKVALYYGCLLSRQSWITGFDVTPRRTFLEDLTRVTGAELVHWSYERQCCGAGLAVTKPPMADSMVAAIHGQAIRAGAHCLVAFCPLCHMNLELRGGSLPRMPVLYFTELVALAIPLPDVKGWLRKHLVDPMPALSSLGLM
jgi:heterodisulfide reductase subunit B